jgi:hypothetical protein
LAANNGDTLGRSSYLCQKQRIQIRTSKRISTQNNNEKIILTSSSTILFSDVSKDANQEQSQDQQVMILRIKSSILLAWPLLPAGVHSLDRVAI